MESAMARLSTGLRINTAADDAAGVAIASRLTSEIRGTNMAIRNAMDGQALIDTAEGAHNEIVNILQRMRELAVQSANDTNDSTDRVNLNAEFKALTTEIDRIAGVTTWAGQSLLTGVGGNHGDGSFILQVGGKTGSEDTIEVAIKAMTSTALGKSDTTTAAADATTAVLTASFADIDLTTVDADLTVTIDGTTLTVGSSDATSLANIVTSLNANDDNTDFTFSTSGTDLVATANASGASVSTFTVAGGGTANTSTAATPATTSQTVTTTTDTAAGDLVRLTLSVAGETDVVIETAALGATASATDIGAALQTANTDTSLYTVTNNAGVVSVSRSDGVNFTATFSVAGTGVISTAAATIN